MHVHITKILSGRGQVLIHPNNKKKHLISTDLRVLVVTDS